MSRLAIVNDRCKPTECSQECRKTCPVNQTGKICIEVSKKSATISNMLCVGCGLCVKRCPFDAIEIVNLPSIIEQDLIHSYGVNSFQLYRLPTPRKNSVLGLIGMNGVGKSTTLKILSGKLTPNFGGEQTTVVNKFRGSELQNYFTELKTMTCKVKPQFIDHLARVLKGTVEDIISVCSNSPNYDDYDLTHLKSRNVTELSGGELQRLSCMIMAVQNPDVIFYDEPTSYLDIHQRIKMSRLIRSITPGKYIVVVEHDLAMLDYLSDYITILYGVPGAYGVATQTYSTSEGINVFLDGYLPGENVKLRDPIIFINQTPQEEDDKPTYTVTYPEFICEYESFVLQVESGVLTSGEITVLLGANGTGKTSMLRHLVNNELLGVVSYKPQLMHPKWTKTVAELFCAKIREKYVEPSFHSDIIKPLGVDKLLEMEVQHLSGGELQRVALTLCLGKTADVYLIDEPSTYLDVEQRVAAAKVIKRFIMNQRKMAFVVEHDFIMSTYLANNVIMFSGEPGQYAVASAPESLITGMNKFLAELDVTYRRDKTNLRPRINKLGSVKDVEQKLSGNYFFLD